MPSGFPVTNFKITLNPDMTLTETQGKLVLFSKKTGDFFGLNESALFLLKTLLESDFSTALVKGAQEFQVEPSLLEQDLVELVSELEKTSIIKKVL